MIEEESKDIEQTKAEDYEDDDYVMDRAFKSNHKTDVGGARKRPRVPLHRITLEHEEELPKMPEVILPQPNDKHYEKLLKENDEQQTHHKKSIDELFKKIESARFGNSPDITKLIAEREILNKEKEPWEKELKEKNEAVKGPSAKIKELKGVRDSLQKELEVTSLKQLDQEVKKIQERLGFSALTSSEEKKLIDRKNKLEAQKPNLAKFSDLKEQIKKLFDSNQTAFDAIKILREKVNGHYEKVHKISDKLKEFKKKSEENDPVVKQLQTQRENIKEEKSKCFAKKKEITKEWNDKWYFYNKQQEEVLYIKDALAKIKELKKRAEREKKIRDKQNKENADAGTQETTGPREEVERFAYEINSCEWLIQYFKNLAGGKVEATPSNVVPGKTAKQGKLDEDISKGLIKPFQRNDQEMELGLSGEGHKKKKEKGPKVSKREQKTENTNILNLDISIIQRIKDVSLTPPAHKTEVTTFVTQLEKARDKFKTDSETVKKGGSLPAEKKEEAKPAVVAVEKKEEAKPAVVEKKEEAKPAVVEKKEEAKPAEKKEEIKETPKVETASPKKEAKKEETVSPKKGKKEEPVSKSPQKSPEKKKEETTAAKPDEDEYEEIEEEVEEEVEEGEE